MSEDFTGIKTRKKDQNLKRYLFEYWYRHGNFQKDFKQIEVEAKTEAEATVFVKEQRRWIFKIELLLINGQKVL